MKTGERGSELLSSLIQRIRGGWPGAAWEWDARLDCALSTAAKAEEAQAQAQAACGRVAVEVQGACHSGQ